MNHYVRFLHLSLLVGLLADVAGQSARASSTILAHYRCGEFPDSAVHGSPVTLPVRDASGNGLHMDYLVGASWSNAAAPSSNASGFSFGGGAWFAYRPAVLTSLNDTVGMEVWVKSNAPSQTSVIAHNGKTAGSDGTNGLGFLQSGSNWTGHLAGTSIVGSSPVVVGEWTHLALVCDSAAWGGTRFYVNGQLAGFAPGLGSPPTTAFSLGADVITPGGSQFFNGSVDEVRVFSFASGSFNPATDLLFDPPAVASTKGFSLAEYRLGEDDPGAADGASLIASPREHTNSRLNLIRHGTPTYSNDGKWPSPGSFSSNFDGTSMLYRGAPVNTATDNYALSAWVNASGTSTGGQDKVIVWNGDPKTDGFGIVQRDAKFVFRHGGTDLAETEFAAGGWLHLALIRDNGINHCYTGFLELTSGSSAPSKPTAAFQIAGDPTISGGADYFTGKIDEMRCYTFDPGTWSLTKLLPAQLTRTGRAAVRFEARTTSALDPLGNGGTDGDIATRQAYNLALIETGRAEAITIGIEDGHGRPLWDPSAGGSPSLRPSLTGNDLTTSTQLLKDWVNEIHTGTNGQSAAALSWIVLYACETAYADHTDWRVKKMDGSDMDDGLSVCFNTGYGDALINMLVQGVKSQAEGGLGLDGYWIDGVWTGNFLANTDPSAMGCACTSCKTKFRNETGYDFPSSLNWENKNFQRWLNWRYENFAVYLARLAKAVRDVKPNSVIVMNQNNRPDINWSCGGPLQKWSGDVIPTSESTGDLDECEFKARLVRAQKAESAEMWRQIENSSERVIRYMLTDAQNGTVPYPAAVWNTSYAPTILAEMQGIMKAVHPYIRSKPAPYAGLLISRDTATHFFGRPEDGSTNTKSDGQQFWRPLMAWARGLSEQRMAPEFVFENELTGPNLARYHVLFAPQSVCLSATAAEKLRAWVQDGGTLVLGPGAGECDEWGTLQTSSPLKVAFGYDFTSLPRRDDSGASTGGFPLVLARSGLTNEHSAVDGEFVPVLLDANWTTLWQKGIGDTFPAIATRTYGSGRVYLCAVSPFRGSADTLSLEAEGLAECAFDSSMAAIKFVESPFVSSSVYPHMGRVFPPVKKEDGFDGVLFECDLFVTGGADVVISQRNTPDTPNYGPQLRIVGNDYMYADGVRLNRFGSDLTPMNEWMHIKVDYDFSTSSTTKPAYTATVTTASRTYTASAAGSANGFQKSNWLAIYGQGSTGTFWVKNVKLSKTIGSNGTTVFNHAFDTPDSTGDTASPAAIVSALIAAEKRPPVKVLVPGGTLSDNKAVRTDVFDAGQGRYLVHLFNRKGKKADWQSTTAGADVTIECDFPVSAARRIVTGTDLTPDVGSAFTTLSVPKMGLYEIVEIQRADLLDSDSDGMPDTYEEAHGLNKNAEWDAATDADGDGIGNLSEYQSGTAADDPNSYLRITNIQQSGASGIEIQFPTVAGRTYRLECSYDLGADSWFVVDDDIVGDGNPIALIDETAMEEERIFYRVRRTSPQ